jgi:hypothetical protein
MNQNSPPSARFRATVKEASAETGVPVPTIHRWMSGGAIESAETQLTPEQAAGRHGPRTIFLVDPDEIRAIDDYRTRLRGVVKRSRHAE